MFMNGRTAFLYTRTLAFSALLAATGAVFAAITFLAASAPFAIVAVGT
jgi:hypothetical protein